MLQTRNKVLHEAEALCCLIHMCLNMSCVVGAGEVPTENAVLCQSSKWADVLVLIFLFVIPTRRLMDVCKLIYKCA